MVSPVEKPHCRWFVAHDICFEALVDAHEKADTIHRDVALGNIILARLEEKMERVGYLIDWELSCKLNKATAREHALTVRPILLSPGGSLDAFKGDSRLYVHQSVG